MQSRSPSTRFDGSVVAPIRGDASERSFRRVRGYYKGSGELVADRAEVRESIAVFVVVGKNVVRVRVRLPDHPLVRRPNIIAAQARARVPETVRPR